MNFSYSNSLYKPFQACSQVVLSHLESEALLNTAVS